MDLDGSKVEEESGVSVLFTEDVKLCNVRLTVNVYLITSSWEVLNVCASFYFSVQN